MPENPPEEIQDTSPNSWMGWLGIPAGETEAASQGKLLPGEILPEVRCKANPHRAPDPGDD